MTPEELELARALLASVQNTTVQGWDILVRGTAISNAINLVTIAVSILISFVASYISYRNDLSHDAGLNAIVAFVAIGFICLVVLYRFVGNSLLGVFAPEYTILNNIINNAGGGQ